MVSSISSVGAYQNLYTPNITSTDKTQKFDESVGAAPSSQPTEGVAEGSGSSEAEKSYEPADLNKDGTVTQEEMAKYMQMQMAAKETENIMSQVMDATGEQDASADDSKKDNQNYNTEEFKMKQAASSYKNMDSLDLAVNLIGFNFAV